MTGKKKKVGLKFDKMISHKPAICCHFWTLLLLRFNQVCFHDMFMTRGLQKQVIAERQIN